MKNFTQQEIQHLHEALECLGRTKGLRYFGICGMLANKLTIEFRHAQNPIELSAADLASPQPVAIAADNPIAE